MQDGNGKGRRTGRTAQWNAATVGELRTIFRKNRSAKRGREAPGIKVKSSGGGGASGVTRGPDWVAIKEEKEKWEMQKPKSTVPTHTGSGGGKIKKETKL